MKATLDLPDDLLKEMKLRAVHEGRKFKDVAAEVFRRGLAQPAQGADLHHRVKLPVIVSPPGTPTVSLTGEDIDRLLMEDEIKWHHESSGH